MDSLLLLISLCAPHTVQEQSKSLNSLFVLYYVLHAVASSIAMYPCRILACGGCAVLPYSLAHPTNEIEKIEHRF